MKCNHCGKEIPNDSNFCEFCGKKVKKKMPVWAVLLIVLGCVTVLGMGIAMSGMVLDELQNVSQPRDGCITGNYVDLGLPSGTRWKESNEGDQGNGEIVYYDYDEAVQHFGSSLPTKEQWEELNNSCTWEWTGSGYNVTGPNGQTITLPAAGGRDCDGDVYDVGSDGHYWSSTPYDSFDAWYLYFNSGGHYMYRYYRCYGRSVRLVQD